MYNVAWEADDPLDRQRFGFQRVATTGRSIRHLIDRARVTLRHGMGTELAQLTGMSQSSPSVGSLARRASRSDTRPPISSGHSDRSGKDT